MTKHKTEDYKIYAVKYYLNNSKERPNYLSRSNNFSGFLQPLYIQNAHFVGSYD